MLWQDTLRTRLPRRSRRPHAADDAVGRQVGTGHPCRLQPRVKRHCSPADLQQEMQAGSMQSVRNTQQRREAGAELPPAQQASMRGPSTYTAR